MEQILPEKLIVPKLVKIFPAYYGNRRFITSFTTARHLFLSWTTSIQPIPRHPTSCQSVLILFSHLRLGDLSGVSATSCWIYWPAGEWKCTVHRAKGIFYINSKGRNVTLLKWDFWSLRNCFIWRYCMCRRYLAILYVQTIYSDTVCAEDI
jgi:hypothetical protein